MKIDEYISQKIDEFINELFDEKFKGECFFIDLERKYKTIEKDIFLVEVDHLICCKNDPPENDYLIKFNSEIYFPEKLARYNWKIKLQISDIENFIDLINEGSEFKEYVFLDDALISNEDIKRLFDFSGFFLCRNDEYDEVTEEFIKDKNLGSKQSAIRERLLKIIS